MQSNSQQGTKYSKVQRVKELIRAPAVRRIVSAVDSASPILSIMPGKALKYTALGIRVGQVAYSLFDQLIVGEQDPNWLLANWPDDNETNLTKQQLHITLRDLVLGRAIDIHQVGGTAAIKCKEGTVYGKKIRWTATDNDVVLRVLVRLEDEKEVLAGLREDFWSAQATAHVEMTATSFIEVPPDPDDMITTRDVQAIIERVECFQRTGTNRSYLIYGPPGTGKSRAVRHVANALGLKTVTIPLSVLAPNMFLSGSDITGVKQFLSLTMPDVVIFDDLDYLQGPNQAVALSTLEGAHALAASVFVTANWVSRLTPALRRPGRLDDHIPIEGLQPPEVRQVLVDRGLDIDNPKSILHKVDLRMEGWPFAFVQDFVLRVQSLGAERAVSEIPVIQERVEVNKAPPPDDFDASYE